MQAVARRRCRRCRRRPCRPGRPISRRCRPGLRPRRRGRRCRRRPRRPTATPPVPALLEPPVPPLLDPPRRHCSTAVAAVPARPPGAAEPPGRGATGAGPVPPVGEEPPLAPAVPAEPAPPRCPRADRGPTPHRRTRRARAAPERGFAQLDLANLHRVPPGLDQVNGHRVTHPSDGLSGFNRLTQALKLSRRREPSERGTLPRREKPDPARVRIARLPENGPSARSRWPATRSSRWRIRCC